MAAIRPQLMAALQSFHLQDRIRVHAAMVAVSRGSAEASAGGIFRVAAPVSCQESFLAQVRRRTCLPQPPPPGVYRSSCRA